MKERSLADAGERYACKIANVPEMGSVQLANSGDQRAPCVSYYSMSRPAPDVKAICKLGSDAIHVFGIFLEQSPCAMK